MVLPLLKALTTTAKLKRVLTAIVYLPVLLFIGMLGDMTIIIGMPCSLFIPSDSPWKRSIPKIVLLVAALVCLPLAHAQDALATREAQQSLDVKSVAACHLASGVLVTVFGHEKEKDEAKTLHSGNIVRDCLKVDKEAIDDFHNNTSKLDFQTLPESVQNWYGQLMDDYGTLRLLAIAGVN
jgi:hypothetical protein